MRYSWRDIHNIILLYEALENNFIKKEAKDFPMEKPYGFWVSPEGEFLIVGFQAHAAVAREFLNSPQAKKLKYGREYLKSSGAYNIMFANGWARIVCYRNLSFEYYKTTKSGDAIVSEYELSQNPGEYSKTISAELTPKQISWMKYVAGLYDLSFIENSVTGKIVWVNPKANPEDLVKI